MKRLDTPSKRRSFPTHVEIEIMLPAIPNYLQVGPLTLPVSQIKRSVLRQVGAAWVRELVKRGRKP